MYRHDASTLFTDTHFCIYSQTLALQGSQALPAKEKGNRVGKELKGSLRSLSDILFFKKRRAGEITQWLSTFVALPKDPGSVPSIHKADHNNF